MSKDHRKMLMIRRMLGSQEKPMEECQRENIFHTRCSIQGNLCILIIDGGSCTNVASERLVSKLNLSTKPHPRPYKLQWLSEDKEVIVKEQVEVEVAIGKYHDKVLCDVAPMEASHILFGRPWHYDKRTTHDGFSNKITFLHQGMKVVLKPLSPQEVCKDQQKLREKILQEKREKKERESQTLECIKREKENNKKKERNEAPKEGQIGAITKREVKNILLTNLSINCENIFPCTNLFASPNSFSCEKSFLQGFKETNESSYGSLEHQSHELNLLTRGVHKHAQKLEVMSELFGCMVRPFQFAHQFGELVKNLFRSRTQRVMLKFCPHEENRFERLHKLWIDPGDQGKMFVKCSITNSYLFVFVVGSFDLRTNPLQEGGSDENVAKDKDHKRLQGLGLGRTNKSVKDLSFKGQEGHKIQFGLVPIGWLPYTHGLAWSWPK